MNLKLNQTRGPPDRNRGPRPRRPPVRARMGCSATGFGDSSIPWAVLTIVCGVSLIAEMGSFVAAPMARGDRSGARPHPRRTRNGPPWPPLAGLRRHPTRRLLAKVGDPLSGTRRRPDLDPRASSCWANVITATRHPALPQLIIGRGLVGLGPPARA